MNVDRLLAHYERIADAPDAVPRLRRFILDLAVRGKLVAKDPRDEPASKLLERRQIAVSRAEPFELPASWVWVNVGAVAVARLGKMLDKAKNRGTPRRYLRNINVRWFDFDLSNLLEMRFEDSELPEFMLRFDDVLICEGGEPGRAAVWDGRQNDIYFQKAIHRIRLMNIVDSRFFVKALRASADDGRLAEYFTGTGIKHFTGKGLAAYLFPLPPLAEQHRIVAKIDELMALCDRLEVARTRREATRDRLSASSLARLDAPDPDPMVFRNHAAFALEHLTPLTTRRDQIKALRQTILNLAVRGKLVAQDPNDEPASKLLERITKEKARLVKKGELRQQKPPKLGDVNVLPFELKAGWQAVTIEQVLIELQTGPFGSSLHQSDYQVGGVPVVNPASIQNENIVPIEKMAVGVATLNRLSTFKLKAGDIVMGRRGEMGRCAVVTDRETGWLCGTGSLVLRLPQCVYARFFVLLIGSPYVREYLGGSAVGATMQNLNQAILLSLVIGLPPRAEQHRIVTRVDELMALCDGLETSLTTADDTCCRLLGALLIEALEPGGSHASEQAERVTAHG